MATTAHDETVNDVTLPPKIAAMGVEEQVLFERVRGRLGLGDAPAMLGRYQLRGRLGAGGMGVVLRAWDPKLGREIAIKIVSPSPLGSTSKLRARLLREAKLLAKLRHPNVVTVHDVGEHGGEVFIAMEYVPGQSLRAWQQARRRTLPELLRVYIEAGRGLAAAHARGVVHRDFKPENVFIDASEHAIVGDFGLAHGAGTSRFEARDGSDTVDTALSPLTQTGELLGTVAYMAPEQLRGEGADARSDQYSYCVALWEALVGERPFQGPTRAAILESILADAPRGRGQLPGWLRRALERGLDPQPERRHPDSSTLVALLERGLGRGRRWVIGTTLFVAGALGLVSAGVLVERFSTQDCSLATEIDQLRTDYSTAPEVSSHVRARLDSDMRRLEIAARRACAARDLPALQYIERWRATVESVFEASASLDESDLRRLTRWLEHARHDHPPPEPMSGPVFDALVRAQTAVYDSRLRDAVAASNEALELAHTDVDLAEAHLLRGRARSLLGDHVGALDDYDDALIAALRSGFVDAQLRAHLLATRTLVMRLEQLDDGATHHARAEALLVFLKEPALSPRRADSLELSAAIDKRRGQTVRASRTQLRVVRLHYLAGRNTELATALTNLGTIEEGYRDHPRRAELAYRLALAAEPGDSEALLDLVHLVNERPRELDDQELRFVRETLAQLDDLESRDLEVQVRTESLKLALRIDGPDEILACERALLRVLDDAEAGHTPMSVADAWRWMAIARASRGVLDDRYHDAIAAWLKHMPDTQALERIEWELTAVSFAADLAPTHARARLEGLVSELERLPPSPRQRALLDAARALLASLSPPDANP